MAIGSSVLFAKEILKKKKEWKEHFLAQGKVATLRYIHNHDTPLWLVVSKIGLFSKLLGAKEARDHFNAEESNQ